MNITALDIYRNEHDVPLSEITWRPSVYGIVLRDGKILLSPQHGIGHDLPGGGVEIDESLEQALVREVKEETGIEVKPLGIVGCKDSFFVWKPADESQRSAYHSLMYYYACEVTGGELSTAGFDSAEQQYAKMAEWIDISQLDSISQASSVDFMEYIRKAIELYGH